MKKNRPLPKTHGINRRDFLKAGMVMSAAFLIEGDALAAVTNLISPERTLDFFNTHTEEKTKTVYWSGGAYVPEGLTEINRILRDFRTGEIREIDIDLLDLLFNLRQTLRSYEPFHIISGYRCAETNSLLRSRSTGVAKNSLHVEGKAIDIRLPGYELRTVKSAAVHLRGGGVGYYPDSDFVHLDVGRVRYW